MLAATLFSSIWLWMHQRTFHVFVILEDKALTANWNQLSNSEPRRFFFHIPNRKYMRFSIVPKWENISSVIKKKKKKNLIPSHWIRHMTDDLRVTPHSRKCPDTSIRHAGSACQSETRGNNFRRSWQTLRRSHSTPPRQAGFIQSALHPLRELPSPPQPAQPACCTSSFNPSAKEHRSSISTVPPPPPHASLFTSTLRFHLLLAYPPSLPLCPFFFLPRSCNSALAQKPPHLFFFGTSLPPFLSATIPPPDSVSFVLKVKSKKLQDTIDGALFFSLLQSVWSTST